MRQIFGFGLVVMLAGAALGPPALAQGAGPKGGAANAPAPQKAPSERDMKNLALGHYFKGRAADRAGKLQEAYDEYRASFEASADWKTELSWAAVSLKLGKHREAAERYRHVLASPEAKALDPAAEADLRKGFAEAKSTKIGRLQIEGPAGDEIWVEGNQVGVAPLKEEVFVDPGEHVVGARKGGAVVALAHVTVEAGSSAPVKLVEGAGVAPPPSAAPVVTAAPAVTAKSTASAASAASADSPAALAALTLGPKWPFVLALGGAAVTGIIIGAGFWASSEDQGGDAAKTLASSGIKTHADCKSSAGACDKIDGLLRSQDSLQTDAAVAWILGGAAALGAGAIWVLTRRAPPKTGIHVSPVVAPEHAGLTVRGSW